MDCTFDILDLNQRRTRAQWLQLLASTGLPVPAAAARERLEVTFGARRHGVLVATGSAAGSLIEFVAIAPSAREQGRTFNTLLSELSAERARRGIFHLFVATKPLYEQSFAHIGFAMLAQAGEMILMESGASSIRDYLTTLSPSRARDRERLGSIVMHANPFTRGHRYLVEQALQRCDRVLVFVLSDDALFTAPERLALVKAGVADLGDSVTVLAGGDYVVSWQTLPAYFIGDRDAAARSQCQMDARIFRDWLAPTLGITLRLLGEEHRSAVTALYNAVLRAELPPAIEVDVIPRLRDAGREISAALVRAKLAGGAFDELPALVPDSTLTFIHEHRVELQQRTQMEMTHNNAY